MSNGLRIKDICNCDQALTYREALEKIIATVNEVTDETQIMWAVKSIAHEAINHPEAE